MWLVCRGCGEKFLLGKTMGTGYYTHQDNFEDKINEFYNEHSFCDVINEVNNENQFSLEYETAWDKDVKEFKG
jgi:hypothetical protein